MSQEARNKKKILIADDDPGILDALTIMLEDAMYEVIQTTDGNAVYGLMREMPDLLLLDIWMSGVDGRDVCRHIKKDSSTNHIPIIIVSANKDTQQASITCGANDFIAKPFDMFNLLDKIEKHLS